ncbi:exocyst complex component 3 isoform X2 [Microcaecilia unicolor]|nr:exocyst complex component 3-like isoform X2 [Microcaecilia unicolor]
MWLVVRQALFGQENDWQQLCSVMAVLEWEENKNQESLKLANDSSSALKWSEQLENQIKKELRSRISRFPPMDNSDVTAGIQTHFENLEKAFLRNVVSSRLLQETGLLNIYMKSYQDCLLSRASALISVSCSPKEFIVLYKLGREAYENTLRIMRQQQRTERNPGQWEKSLGPTDTAYSDWISTTEEKLINVIQEDIRRKLNSILNNKIKLLSNSPGDILPYHFSEIIQVFATAIEDVQGISSNLTNNVQAVYLEEFLQCIHSCERLIEQFLAPDQSSGAWIYHELRVIEDCSILRDTWHRLVQLLSAPQNINTKVEESIKKTEEQGRNSFLQTLSSTFKKALKDHFCNDSEDFDDALNYLNQRLTDFEGNKAESYERLVTSAHHRVVVEYIRAFLTSARKSTSADLPHITSKIKKDGEKVKDTFQRCLNPDAAALGNPLIFFLDLLQATNIEAIKMTTFFFLENHSDLRKEHLSVILDLKGTVKRKERKVILDYFNGRKRDEDQQVHFFEEIEVNRLRFASHLCSCCV